MLRGYTQESLAHAAGVSTATIQHYEMGTRRPKTKTLAMIADILDCDYTLDEQGNIILFSAGSATDLPAEQVTREYVRSIVFEELQRIIENDGLKLKVDINTDFDYK